MGPIGGPEPTFDVHVHLAGVGTGGSGCWTSPAFRRRITFLALRLLYGINRKQMRETIDQDWAELLSGLIESSDIDYGVALGFDGVYDESGELDRRRSQLIVPQDWVFEVCRRYPNLLPGPSINPYARDALDRLDDAVERGAVLIKWLPIVQGFDPASPRARPFLRRAADAGIPLLIHAGGGEVTFATVDSSTGDVDALVPALELGARVICAHTAAPVLFGRSQIDQLRRLLERFDNLWVDNSGLANPSRARHLPRFAADTLIRSRTLHGSDFPIISNAWHYLTRLGPTQVSRIQREKNGIQREVLIKRAVGFDEVSFTRAGGVLANLERWYGAGPGGKLRR